MVLSAQTIRKLQLIDPLLERTRHPETNMSYGLSSHGYDLRLDQGIYIPQRGFCLASAMEKFTMPNNVMGVVHDKSSLARQGISVYNTVIEAGWVGFLTLEIANHYWEGMHIERGTPIAQVIFHFLDEPTEQPYRGRYQNQEPGPQKARVKNEWIEGWM